MRNDALVKMFTANVRLPEEIAGDLSAMVNVFKVGTRGLETLIERYGVETLDACLDDMIQRSERQMRSYIQDIPDGSYAFEDMLDNDGIDDAPLALAIRVTVAGDRMSMDFTGTSPSCKGPLNLSRNTALSSCYVAIKHIFPDVPVNGGTFRPVEIVIPEGSIMAANYPTPVGGYLEIVGKVIDVVFGALSQAIPERTPAASFGTTGVMTVSGRNPRSGRFYVGVFPYPGGYGATKASDGLIHGNTPQSMANFMSIEMSEHRYPVRFDYFRMRGDSGGAGWHRGGCGSEYRIEARADCTVSVLGDRVDRPPFGIVGGGDAAANLVEFETGGETWTPAMRSKLEKQLLHAGEAVHVASPGGGGFGNPLDRDVAEVERDLNLGYIGRDTAERDYGAVVAEERSLGDRSVYKLDADATEANRLAHRRAAE